MWGQILKFPKCSRGNISLEEGFSTPPRGGECWGSRGFPPLSFDPCAISIVHLYSYIRSAPLFLYPQYPSSGGIPSPYPQREESGVQRSPSRQLTHRQTWLLPAGVVL